MGKTNNWSKEEEQIVRDMLQITKSKKWIRISHKLRQEGYHRTPSECRERFINYLAPNIDKSQITQEELATIYQRYGQLGPKWSQIQLSVKSKTQCKIKNVFYGNVKNLLKTTYKFFTFKTAPFINSISTDYLQAIYDGALQFDGIKQVKEGIRAMGYRNNKYKLIRHINDHKEDYLIVINTVLKEVFKQGPLKVNFDEEHEKKVRKILKNEKNNVELLSMKAQVKCQDQYSQQQQQQALQSEVQRQESKQQPKERLFAIKTQSEDVSIKQEPSNECYSLQKKEESDYFPFLNYATTEAPKYSYPPQPYIGYGHYYPYPPFY